MEPDCKYNNQLICEPCQRQCWRCGWNPKVMTDRLEKLYRNLKKEENE